MEAFQCAVRLCGVTGCYKGLLQKNYVSLSCETMISVASCAADHPVVRTATRGSCGCSRCGSPSTPHPSPSTPPSVRKACRCWPGTAAPTTRPGLWAQNLGERQKFWVIQACCLSRNMNINLVLTLTLQTSTFHVHPFMGNRGA